MGYSEVRCQICGVAFNVGRVRTAGEPLNAAFSWAEQGLNPSNNFVTRESIGRNECPSTSGCSNVKTTRREGKQADDWLLHPGDNDDADYEMKDSSGGESEDGSDFEMRSNDSESIDSPMDTGPLKMSHIPDSPASSMDSEDDESFHIKYSRYQKQEHIAGPGCIHEHGYNGNNITADEMFGCNTVQCLLPKDGFWTPDPSDEDFELNSGYFLSGIGGDMQSRDMGGLETIPLRHDLAKQIYPDDELSEPNDEKAIPFHPSCLEIYKRVSESRFGVFNPHFLWKWRGLECGYHNGIEAISHSDTVIQRALDQWWRHIPGDEWISANPIFIPSLPGILQQALQPPGSKLNMEDSAFPPRLSSFSTGHEDIFSLLPSEIRMQILKQLSSKDIASLRLSSRTFTDLPISLFKHLLQTELPFLFEISTSKKPSKWTCISPLELQSTISHIRNSAAEIKQLQRLHKIVITEEIPEIWDSYCEENPWMMQDVEEAEKKALEDWGRGMGREREMVVLEGESVNWYLVYRLITRHWGELRGLRNRRRVWGVCERICERIERLVEEGKIVE